MAEPPALPLARLVPQKSETDPGGVHLHVVQAETLRDLFERGLELVYDCEHRMVEALPKLSEAAMSTELKQALDEHLEQTRTHVERLEQVFSQLDRAAAKESNHALQGLAGETEKLVEHIDRSPLRDAAIITGGAQVEHYEIGAYESLIGYAETLGFPVAANLLRTTLQEEKAAVERLSQLTVAINAEARGVVTVNHEFNFI